ncbi:hypothetical protein AB0H49_33830 [Nocardia sp. NPDC050713]|uniref:hypothetical protein n=1 Tax=Nocardia sp. NPDC050713 TaxID=3154511 RepID=UPI0033F00903
MATSNRRRRRKGDDLNRQILAQGFAVLAGAFAVLQLLMPLMIDQHPVDPDTAPQVDGCQVLVI